MRHVWPDHFADEGFQSAARGGSSYVASHSWIALMIVSRVHAIREVLACDEPFRTVTPATVAGAMWVSPASGCA